MRIDKNLKLLIIALITAVSLATFGETASAQRPIRGKDPNPSHSDPSYSGIYVFGDSLSDTGNLFSLTGSPPPPYFEGRFSNGLVWVEYLAQSLEVEEGSLVNFAIGGATTGRDNFNDIPGFVEFPGLLDQIDLFEFGLGGNQADPDALYIVWAGANDFFLDGPSWSTIANGVSNTATAVERLHQRGAEHILVVNLPDLGSTPFGLSEDPFGLSFASAFYNFVLDINLYQLRAGGIKTTRLDVFGLMRKIVARPDRYNFTNVTDPYLLAGGDPDTFLFWDTVHPTTRGHEIFADAAMKKLRRRSTRRGR